MHSYIIRCRFSRMATNDEALTQLRRYEHKIKVQDMDSSKKVVENTVERCINEISLIDERFTLNEEKRGSVYEKLKIDEPDEFDFDLPIVDLARDTLKQQSYCDLREFTLFNLESAESPWRDCGIDGYLSSQKVFDNFHSLVQEACKQIGWKEHSSLEVTKNPPAVTVKIPPAVTKNPPAVTYRDINIDLAPVIEIKQWPGRSLENWIDRCFKKEWPSKELIEKVAKSSVLLVPKRPKDGPGADDERLWKYAFNKAEKALLLDTWPSIPNNCRRRVLKVLKGFNEDWKWGLKSYHIKTLMFHQFEECPATVWTDENFLLRVNDAMEMLCKKLEQRKLAHYFLPAVNLFKKLDFDWVDQTVIPQIYTFLENPAHSLEKLNILHGDSFKVFISDGNGKKWRDDVDNYMSIDELKRNVSTRKGIAVNQFWLSYRGHPLISGTVGSNEIEKDSEIQMQVRLRGGT